jgi:LacI family transcriptional regulator
LIGRTPKQEMLRIQLERAKQLLAETDWTVAEIALQCGFS